MVICDGDAEEVFAEGVCDPGLVGMPALVEEEDGGDAEGLSIRSRKCSEPSPVDVGSATGDGRQVDGVKVRRDVALGVVGKSLFDAKAVAKRDAQQKNYQKFDCLFCRNMEKH